MCNLVAFLYIILLSPLATFALTAVDRPVRIDANRLKNIIKPFIIETLGLPKSFDQLKHWKMTINVGQELMDSSNRCVYHPNNKNFFDVVYNVNNGILYDVCADLGTVTLEPIHIHAVLINVQIVCPMDRILVMWACLIGFFAIFFLLTCLQVCMTRDEPEIIKPEENDYIFV